MDVGELDVLSPTLTRGVALDDYSLYCLSPVEPSGSR